MKNYLYLLPITFALLFGSCTNEDDEIVVSGSVSGEFSLVGNADVEVNVLYGEEFSFSANGSVSDQSALQGSVTLTGTEISVSGSISNLSSSAYIDIYIPNLQSIINNSAGDISVAGAVEKKHICVEVNGNGDVDLGVVKNNFFCALVSGNGELLADSIISDTTYLVAISNGKMDINYLEATSLMNVSIEGNNVLNIDDVVSPYVDFSMESNSAFALSNLTTSTLELDVDGNGELTLSGSEVNNAKVDGGANSDINLSGLSIKTLDISLTGNGDAKVDVVDDLKVGINQNAQVTYTGQPTITIVEQSGNAQLIDGN